MYSNRTNSDLNLVVELVQVPSPDSHEHGRCLF